MAAAFAIVGHAADTNWTVAPEGDEDITIKMGQRTFQVQVRSRRDQRTAVTASQLGDWLAEIWTRHADNISDPGTIVAVVLDRPVTSVDAQGFTHSLVGQASTAALADRLHDVALQYAIAPEDLLQRSLLFLAEDPIEFASALLSEHRDLPRRVAEVAVRQVLARLGELADLQGAPSAPPAQNLAAGEVSGLVDRTIAVVDLERLEQPVRDGFCEHADFVSPVAEPNFYLGVDVVPGHVPAGLLVDRPDEVQRVIESLGRTRTAVVAGPSGVGKTALALLAAYELRHTIRWLRVRSRGNPNDLLLYAEALGAGIYSPIGLIVDDIGRLGADLWDTLAREVRHRPGVVLLGTTREEDLGTLAEAPESVVIRPRLSAPLAEALWRHLASGGHTSAAGWQEASDESAGLTLEFVHILTTTQRLPDVVRQQVDSRRREGRDDELSVLRLTSLVAAHGASTDLGLLSLSTGLSTGDMQRAMVRLLDEHLIRRLSEDRIAGLHQLRSTALVDALHHVPPPTLAETAAEALGVVAEFELADLIGSLVADSSLDPELAFRALTDRLLASPTVTTTVGCLDGLRLAGQRLYANAAGLVLDSRGVPKAMRHATTLLAVASTGEVSEAFDSTVRAAVPELRDLAIPDLREQWINRAEVRPALEAALGAEQSPESATELLAAFADLDCDPPAALRELAASVVVPSDIALLARLTSAARLAGPEPSEALLDAVGGETVLLHRVATEVPWITTVDMTDESPGSGEDERVIRFEYLAVDDAEDPHDAVVRLCHLLINLFPDADVAAGTAVDAAGNAVGFRGYDVAVKRIPRRNLPSEFEVRWNQSLLRSCALVAGIGERTALLQSEAELLERARQVLADCAELWVRGNPLREPLLEELSAISSEADKIWKTWERPDLSESGENRQPDIGDLASACKLLCGNALPRLLERPDRSLAAFMVDTVQQAFARLVGVSYWHLITEDHDDELEEIVRVLGDVHVVLLRRLEGSKPSSAMRRAARSAQPVERSAARARTEQQAAFEAKVEQCRSSLEVALGSTKALTMPSEGTHGLFWPTEDIAYLIDCASAFEWLISSDRTLDLVADAGFAPGQRISLIPATGGVVLPDLAVRVFGGSKNDPFPAADSALAAALALGQPTHQAEATALLAEVLSEGSVIEAMEKLASRRSLAPSEEKRYQDAEAALDNAVSALSALVEADASGVLAEIIQPLAETLDDDSALESISAFARGENEDLSSQVAVFGAAAIEADIDPDHLLEKLERFVDQLPAPT